MRILIYILTVFLSLTIKAQSSFHVFPDDRINETGDGSLNKPWDLQTALSQSADKINGGDIIWIHEGTYNGRYSSSLNSNNNGKIIVKPYKNAKVILNGNIASSKNAVLEVMGKGVTFQDLEITFLGEFKRNESDSNFKPVYGINHLAGSDCEFVNLKIHNNPGVGFGSWRKTGNTKIIGCTIFNNGYIGKKRGRGVGIYVQNESDDTRLIKDNLIFNNYYKGVEIWSANRHAKFEFVKNVAFVNNVVFNNGNVSGGRYDNLIVGTDDRDGKNIAKNITISNNVFYHNTNINNAQINGDAPSLTIGFTHSAPVENLTVNRNIVIGRNNALRLLHINSAKFSNNLVYSGYVHSSPVYLKSQDGWDFSNNHYYTKRNTPFYFGKSGKLNLADWQKNITQDINSEWHSIKDFQDESIIKVQNVVDSESRFRVTLFNMRGEDVLVDFSEYGSIKAGDAYKIKDIETDESIAGGVLDQSKRILVSIGARNKTISNFGVFTVEFGDSKIKEKRKTVLGKFFKWLGF